MTKTFLFDIVLLALLSSSLEKGLGFV